MPYSINYFETLEIFKFTLEYTMHHLIIYCTYRNYQVLIFHSFSTMIRNKYQLFLHHLCVTFLHNLRERWKQKLV